MYTVYFWFFLVLTSFLVVSAQEPMSNIARLRRDLLRNYDRKARPVVQHQNTTQDTTQEPMSNIARLRRDLLRNYDRKARPVVQHQNTTVVHIEVSPVVITELDEKKSIFDIDTWIKMHWDDQHLTWDPHDYEGLKSVHFAHDELWRPDVSVYTAAESSIDPLQKTIFIAYPSGDVHWVPPAKLRLLCQLNYDNYPEDVQECSAKLGSWTFDGNMIDFQLHQELANGSGDCSTEDFSDVNPFWKLERCHASRQVTIYPCCAEPYVSVSFNFFIRRRGSPAQQSQRVIRKAAHVLILSMFWVHLKSVSKLMPGLFGILCYAVALVMLCVTVPSPIAANAALSSLYPEIYVSLAAIVTEIFIVNIGLIRNLSLPHTKFISSDIFQAIFCLCARPSDSISYDRVTTATASMSEELVNLETESVRVKEESGFVATMMDRISFLIFLIAFLVTGNYF